MEEEAKDGGEAREEPHKLETEATILITPRVGDESKEKNGAPREEFEKEAIETLNGPVEERKEDVPKTFEISCTTRKKFIENACINPDLPINAMSLSLYNEAFPQQVTYEGHNMVGTVNKAPIEVGRFTFDIELTILNDMGTIAGPTSADLVLGKPFMEATEVILDYEDGSALFTDGVRRVIFRDGKEEVYEYEPSTMNNIWGLQGRRPGRIKGRDPSNLKIPCMIGHRYFYNVYIDTCLPKNVMSLFHYNNICRWGMVYKGKDDVGIDNAMHVLVGNMVFTTSFTIVDNIEEYIDPRLGQIVLGAPFCNTASLVVDEGNGVMTFTDGIKRVSYQTPYKAKEFREIDCEGLDELGSQLILCDDDVRRGCETASDLESGFYKEVDKLSPKYRTAPFEFKDPRYLHYESDVEEGSTDDLDDEFDDGVT